MPAIASQLRLSQRQSQRTTLTLMQRQSVELLQLTAPELASAVDEALASNPLLEALPQDETAEAAPPEPAEPAAEQKAAFDAALGMDANFERSREAALITWKKTAESADRREDDDSDPFARLAHERTLTEHLMEQLSCARAPDSVRLLTAWLIGNLTEEGFLAEAPGEVFSTCPVPATDRERAQALALLQGLDPAGVGARNAVEALLLQLSRRAQSASGDGAQRIALAQALLTHCAPELMRRDFKAAARMLESTAADVQAAFELISELNPHPASDFADVRESAFVVPEIIVTREDAPQGPQWVARLNAAIVPRLRFDFENFELLTRAKLSREQKSAWNRMAGEARSFVHALEFRFSTITAVAQKIVDLQRGFFSKGPAALRPLQLRDVAQALGMSESTISRATSGKYMQTPLGTFELKHFFGTGFASGHGEQVSAAAVRGRIRALVAAEDPARPLSDGAIAEALAREGVQIARRTVAKYRELEHIAPKSLRRQQGADAG